MAALQFATALSMADDPQRRISDDHALRPGRRIRILSVSPEEDDHNALFQIVDELPFAVTAARTCGEAATHLGMAQFDIILCECKLPDGNWSEILNRISGAAEEPCSSSLRESPMSPCGRRCSISAATTCSPSRSAGRKCGTC